MVILDTNMILRYLLNDNEEMADEAEELINTETCSVTIEVIAEVVYVLKGVYSLERHEISATIKGFLELVNCSDADVLNQALEAYSDNNLDFVDCVLFAYHKARNAEIATFDRKLLNLIKKSDIED